MRAIGVEFVSQLWMVTSPVATLCLLVAGLPVIIVSRIRVGPLAARVVVTGNYSGLTKGNVDDLSENSLWVDG